MNDKDSDNAFMIQAYFNDLEKRIAFLKELYDGDHTDEALMLCCCYIEALGSRQYHDSDRKAKNYYRTLEEHSGNKLFTLIHPKQLRNVLMSQKLFKANITQIKNKNPGDVDENNHFTSLGRHEGRSCRACLTGALG